MKQPKLKIGQKIAFKKGNKNRYDQDFSFYTGVPSNIEFTIEEIWSDRLILVADGYGSKKDYGNGRIYVWNTKEDKLQLIKPKTKKNLLEDQKKKLINSNKKVNKWKNSRIDLMPDIEKVEKSCISQRTLDLVLKFKKKFLATQPQPIKEDVKYTKSCSLKQEENTTKEYWEDSKKETATREEIMESLRNLEIAVCGNKLAKKLIKKGILKPQSKDIEFEDIGEFYFKKWLPPYEVTILLNKLISNQKKIINLLTKRNIK